MLGRDRKKAGLMTAVERVAILAETEIQWPCGAEKGNKRSVGW